MIQVAIIADDFTGALDTGVKFTQCGIKTKIFTINDHELVFTNMDGVEVIIVDTETRHSDSHDAYLKIKNLVIKLKTSGVSFFYKKVDSGLRGNIPSELRALIDGTGEKFLAFAPSFPELNRFVKKGICYIDSVPVHQSIYGMDPFEPVESSNIKELIKSIGYPVKNYYEIPKTKLAEEIHVGIFDAETSEELKKIAEYLYENNEIRITAGCAAFATELKNYYPLHCMPIEEENISSGLILVSGSLNSVSLQQVERAQKDGYRRVSLTKEQKQREDYLETTSGKQWMKELVDYCKTHDVCMIDTGAEDSDELRNINLEKDKIGIQLGKILKCLLENDLKKNIMIIGGDTLYYFMSTIKCDEISPIKEIEEGTVLAKIKYNGRTIYLITKSGGFGDSTLIVSIINKLCKKE